VKPGDVSAETGYSIGAAGIGAALLHEAIVFPDSPFPHTHSEIVRTSALEVDFNEFGAIPTIVDWRNHPNQSVGVG
jgi:hypothetical protein